MPWNLNIEDHIPPATSFPSLCEGDGNKLQGDTTETEEVFADDDDTSDNSEEDEELCQQLAIASSTMMAYGRSAKALIHLVCNQDDEKVTFWETCNQSIKIRNATFVEARMAKSENRECWKQCRPGWPPNLAAFIDG